MRTIPLFILVLSFWNGLLNGYQKPLTDTNFTLTLADHKKNIVFDLYEIQGVPDDLELTLMLEKEANRSAIVTVTCNEQFLGTMLLNSIKKIFSIPREILFNEGNVISISLGATLANGQDGLPDGFAISFNASQSFFTWYKYALPLRNITQFLMISGGRIGLFADDINSSFVKTFSQLWEQINSNAKNLQTLPIESYSKAIWNEFDYIVLITNKTQLYKNLPINLSKGSFKFENPITKRILFDSKTTSLPYWLWQLDRNRKKPILAIHSSNPEADFPVTETTLNNLKRQAASVAVTLVETGTTSYETNKQLVVTYDDTITFKGVWYKYRLYFMAILTLFFIIIIYHIAVNLKGAKGNV
ncbi:MAG: hypothetical protein JHC93_04670 [Parachlamydiales bacterium]|nr:hypothetical protein [Parachlamydiales bacterium]